MSNRIVHFEIPVSDSEKVADFYKKTFGWQFQKWEGGDEPYWLIMTGDREKPGIDGGLMNRRDPQQPIVNTLDVADLGAAMKAVEANGGEIVVPKMPIPTVGWLAYFKDVEGNIFGMMQSDSQAG